MNRLISLVLFILAPTMSISAQLTIEDCVKKAQDNYPLIRKYDLLAQVKEIDLSDINKSWLPRVGLYAQLTGQNVVPSFPEALTGVLQQMGQSMRGLGKIQYKAGVDVTQNIWDGGYSAVRREMVQAQDEVQKSALDIELYNLRERVENIYFAILLTEEQIAQNKITSDLIASNLEKMRVMLKNGVAMQSDVDMLEAQSLTLAQTITLAKSAVKGYRDVLGIFIGEDVSAATLKRPTSGEPINGVSGRPELKLFNDRLKLNSLTDKMTQVSIMPKIGFFAQAYYGYPGFNYFQSMMNRNLSFNVLAGIKASWNIDALYTRKNSNRRDSVNAADIETDRDLFLYNSNIQVASQRDKLEGIRNSMKEDARIVELRSRVRKAAESQLDNGVIDATALLSKIADENMSELMARYHEIQLIQEIYKLKYLLNQ